ncbi:hypothetical protein [Paenibacillus sp. sgz302251]|uniref:hypothetical protein n=1 Tax=Paenibacillus sp. sgz302251 TaxID=3414493 RepID=UPI003C7E33A5
MIGIKPHEYNDMTPHELNLCIEAYLERTETERKGAEFLAYMNAKFPLYKKFPKTFDEAFGYDKEAKQAELRKEQTEDQMLKKIMELNAAFGGTVY